MPAIINHKICDQSSACGGIAVCPTGAFHYNEQTKRIEIDNSKCISCGACERSCPIKAIGVAKTKEEYEELKQAIEEDPRSQGDLFVDRFGGDVVNQDVMIDFKNLDEEISRSNNEIIEIFNDDSIMCLLKSIPYKEILNNSNYTSYKRCNIKDNNFLKYNAAELPSLLLCKNGKLFKTISGYYEERNKNKLFNLLK